MKPGDLVEYAGYVVPVIEVNDDYVLLGRTSDGTFFGVIYGIKINIVNFKCLGRFRKDDPNLKPI
jgi:hypothetical protein